MPVQKGAADAAAKLIAKYGKSAVSRALKAANTPAKGDKAQNARDFGKLYTEYKKIPVKKREQNVMARVYKYNTPKGKAKGPQTAEDLDKMKKALKNSKPPKRTTETSLPSPVARNNAYARNYNKQLKNKTNKK